MTIVFWERHEPLFNLNVYLNGKKVKRMKEGREEWEEEEGKGRVGNREITNIEIVAASGKFSFCDLVPF